MAWPEHHSHPLWQCTFGGTSSVLLVSWICKIKDEVCAEGGADPFSCDTPQCCPHLQRLELFWWMPFIRLEVGYERLGSHYLKPKDKKGKQATDTSQTKSVIKGYVTNFVVILLTFWERIQGWCDAVLVNSLIKPNKVVTVSLLLLGWCG